MSGLLPVEILVLGTGTIAATGVTIKLQEKAIGQIGITSVDPTYSPLLTTPGPNTS